MRLPRPCRLRSGGLSVRSLTSACEIGVGEPLSRYLAHRQMEAISIVQRIVLRGAIVEPKNLFRNVTVKMKRFNSDIGSAKTALQETPEVLYSLSVDFATYVFFDVVDGFMNASQSHNVGK